MKFHNIRTGRLKQSQHPKAKKRDAEGGRGSSPNSFVVATARFRRRGFFPISRPLNLRAPINFILASSSLPLNVGHAEQEIRAWLGLQPPPLRSSPKKRGYKPLREHLKCFLDLQHHAFITKLEGVVQVQKNIIFSLATFY